MNAEISVPIGQVPNVARNAWLHLRERLHVILGEDLVALWGHGGTIARDRPQRFGDLDTYAVVGRPVDDQTAARIDDAHDIIGAENAVEWDAWYVLEDDARRAESPRHAFHEGRRDTAWAIHRAHWLAGRYIQLEGREPGEIVPSPTWAELEVDLRRELEHIERHVVEGDDDPREATYAILNGSRILHAVETGNVVISKRSAGAWALKHLPSQWHPAVNAARRAYDAEATPEDTELLATKMRPFVEMVRSGLPKVRERVNDVIPRWSGF